MIVYTLNKINCAIVKYNEICLQMAKDVEINKTIVPCGKNLVEKSEYYENIILNNKGFDTESSMFVNMSHTMDKNNNENCPHHFETATTTTNEGKSFLKDVMDYIKNKYPNAEVVDADFGSFFINMHFDEVVKNEINNVQKEKKEEKKINANINSWEKHILYHGRHMFFTKKDMFACDENCVYR